MSQPKTEGSPTLMSGTPILLSGFLSSIFRIRSFSSSLTFGLKRRTKEMRGRWLGRILSFPPLPPALLWGFPR